MNTRSYNPCCAGQAGAYAQSCELNKILNQMPQPYLTFKAKLKYPKAPKVKAPRAPKVRAVQCQAPCGPPPQPIPVPMPLPLPAPSPCGGGFGGGMPMPMPPMGGGFGGGFGGGMPMPMPPMGGGFGGPLPQPAAFHGPAAGSFPPGQPTYGAPGSNGVIPQQHHTLAFTQRQLRRIQRKSAKGKQPKACGGIGGGSML